MQHLVRIKQLLIVLPLAVTIPDPRDGGPTSLPHPHPQPPRQVTAHHFLTSIKNTHVLLVTVQKDSDVNVQVIANHGVPSLNTSDDRDVWEVPENGLPGVMSGNCSKESWGSSVQGILFLQKDLALMNSASLPTARYYINIRGHHNLNALPQLLNNILFSKGQNCAEEYGTQMVSNTGNGRLPSGLFMLHATVELSPPLPNPATCRQNVRESQNVDISPTHPVSLLSVDITFTQFYWTSMSPSPPIRPCVPHHPDHWSQEVVPRTGDQSLSAADLETLDPVPEELPEIPQPLSDRHFLDYPFWSKLFTFKSCNQSSQKEPFHKFTHVNNFALGPFNRDILLSLIVLMTIIFRCLTQPLEANKTKNDNNVMYLQILTRCFFLKWNWNHGQKSRPSVSRKTSQVSALNSYIFQPWLAKTGWRTSQPVSAPCCSSASLLCSSCQRHFKHFLANNHRLLQANPAFLPAATGNPRHDFAHVGYRLATLAALPSSVLVSKIKLAGAGFFYQGHGDEVLCYSCQSRHSGWRREDNPTDIHRQLSPTCQHVLQTDRELSEINAESEAITGQNSFDNGPGPASSHTPGSSHSTGNTHTPGNSHTTSPGQAPGDGRASRTQLGQNTPAEDSQSSTPEADSEESTHASAASASGSAMEHSPVTANTVRQGPSATGGLNAESTPSSGTATPHAATASSVTQEGHSSATTSTISQGRPSSVTTSTVSQGGYQSTTSSPESQGGYSSATTSTISQGRPSSATTSTISQTGHSSAITSAISQTGHSSATTSTISQGGQSSTTISAVSQVRHPSNVPSVSNYGMMAEATSTSSSTPVTTVSRMTPVPPNDRSSSSQNEAAARADCRPLFPRARLELGAAVYPMYQDMASRRRTFTTWDSTRAPPLEEIILSGMFYAGYSDCVRCFYCGVGLKHWVVTDNVWDEHVRWRPGCGFLRAVKGDHFIRDTQRRLGIESSHSPQDPDRNGPPSGNSNDNPHSLPRNQGQQPSSSSCSRGATATSTATSPASARQPSSSASIATAGAAAAASGTTSMLSPSSLHNGVADVTERRREEDGRANEAEDRRTLASLQAEHQQLSQQLHCRVCRRSCVDTILLPCGHLVLCQNCAGYVTSCPLCGNTIQATAKVHFAD